MNQLNNLTWLPNTVYSVGFVIFSVIYSGYIKKRRSSCFYFLGAMSYFIVAQKLRSVGGCRAIHGGASS